MVERIKVGIIYENNENWIGGTYYIQNLIAALCTLPDEQKPALTILAQSEKEFEEIKRIGYPYLAFNFLIYTKKSLNLIKRIVNKINYFFTGYDLFPQPLGLAVADLDIIFPVPVGLKTGGKQKNLYWIPDFQEQFLPHFFSKQEIIDRTQSHRFIAKSQDQVVFSSQDAFNTFSKLFPGSLIRKYILQFAVKHSANYVQLDLGALQERYHIDKPYFFAPNQFWKHKNQVVIIKAINLLKQQGLDNFVVAFSGKEHDYRNPNYFNDLKAFVVNNNLEPYVRFLGFIDRNDQLKLMSEAIAIIQPSLFEGWSTVVEDAKAMDHWVIASDLPVHREQLGENASFFNPEMPEELAEILKHGIINGFPNNNFNYDQQIKKFGTDFNEILKETLTRT